MLIYGIDSKLYAIQGAPSLGCPRMRLIRLVKAEYCAQAGRSPSISEKSEKGGDTWMVDLKPY